MTKKIYYSPSNFYLDVRKLSAQIKDSNITFTNIFGIPSGGVPLATALSSLLDIPLCEDPLMYIVNNQEVLIVDDVTDSGETLLKYADFCCAVIHHKPKSKRYPVFAAHRNVTEWIHYFWEGSEIKDSITNNITRVIQYIGEDPNREGLLETPKRVVKSWKKLYGGYSQNPADIIKTFDADGADQIVLLKNIEFFSMCEHHMLPFFGKSHIAYIPNERVIGISKLARLLEIFTRRLQIQERIGEQVTKALMEYLQPKAAACILEAQHHCMTSRGIEKQHSIMVTSSLKGAFIEKQEARLELMRLIR